MTACGGTARARSSRRSYQARRCGTSHPAASRTTVVTRSATSVSYGNGSGLAPAPRSAASGRILSLGGACPRAHVDAAEGEHAESEEHLHREDAGAGVVGEFAHHAVEQRAEDAGELFREGVQAEELAGLRPRR